MKPNTTYFLKYSDQTDNETREMFERSVLSPQLAELRNLVTVAYLITEQSKLRKENKGNHEQPMGRY